MNILRRADVKYGDQGERNSNIEIMKFYIASESRDNGTCLTQNNYHMCDQYSAIWDDETHK